MTYVKFHWDRFSAGCPRCSWVGEADTAEKAKLVAMLEELGNYSSYDELIDEWADRTLPTLHTEHVDEDTAIINGIKTDDDGNFDYWDWD